MKVEIEVPDYEGMLRLVWEDAAIIKVDDVSNHPAVHIVANRDGLVSLARLLLGLANDHVPVGSHWHLDDSNSLESGSTELIIERL